MTAPKSSIFHILSVFIAMFSICVGAARASESGMIEVREAITEEMFARMFDVAFGEVEKKAGLKPSAGIYRPSLTDPLSAKNPVRVTYLVKGTPMATATSGTSSIIGNVQVASLMAMQKIASISPETITILIEVYLPPRDADSISPVVVKKVDSGREGVIMNFKGKQTVVGATDCILTGRTVWSHLSNAGLKIKPGEDFSTLSFKFFDSQLAVLLPGRKKPERLFRSGGLVDIKDVNSTNIRSSLQFVADWYLSNVQKDGRFPYSYYPVRNRYTRQNSLLIRDIYGIATVGDIYKALQNATGKHNRPLYDAGVRALDQMLREHYVDDPIKPYGYISDNIISLGNAAAALTAIIRLDQIDRYRETAEKLIAFINAMREPSGRYIALRDNPTSDSGQDYYPGEAQLALLEWCERMGPAANAHIIEEVYKSFRYYRDYYAKKKSTPFIPWHTQACVKLYRITRKSEVAEFVFEMNDYLCKEASQLKDVPDDCLGRFLNPEKRKRNGKPHVSSTGVYLEGLIEAFMLAYQLNEPSSRVNTYRRSVVWGLRDLLQLQVRGDLDTWYMKDPAKAFGGFRTRVDYPMIRIDNQQHCGHAIAKAVTSLTEEDYRLGRNR